MWEYIEKIFTQSEYKNSFVDNLVIGLIAIGGFALIYGLIILITFIVMKGKRK